MDGTTTATIVAPGAEGASAAAAFVMGFPPSSTMTIDTTDHIHTLETTVTFVEKVKLLKSLTTLSRLMDRRAMDATGMYGCPQGFGSGFLNPTAAAMIAAAVSQSDPYGKVL